MSEAMTVVCDSDGRPRCKLHGLRMLNPKVFSQIPLSSADSTNVARNIGVDKNWSTGRYQPFTKEARALAMRHRIERENAPPVWRNK
jgi:hypothetical protein